MRSLRLLSIAALAGAASAEPLLVRETNPLTPEQELKKFTVPDGFEIQLFASEPEIHKPINLAWDDRGRLWVSSTKEYPYAATRDRWTDEFGSRVRDSEDAIKILEDTDGDGRADKVTTFVDQLNIPTGVLPWHQPEHHDGCIAWSIPNIWYFADTTGDGVADHREVLFGPLGWEKDTHGMLSSFRMGPDGWVYATHGFNNESHLKARDGSTLHLHSGNVFRFRPDASKVEIWSRGQVNPFGLCFDGIGNLYSADCHSAPVYQLLRGAIYPSFGKPHDGLGFGPAMIEHSHGSTGIAGIVYFDRDRWGASWNDNMLIGNPVTSRINRDRIEFHGSTPKAIKQPDFLVSKDPWFRPVDFCLGGDGALYVADFYNRIIGHYEVPLDHPGRDRKRGRIWRITKSEDVSKPTPIATPSTRSLIDLKDSSPIIQRSAAAHFQYSPDLEALPLLIDGLERTPESDTHLRHVLRMAIRNHLQLPGAFDHPSVKKCELEIILATPTASAASYLLDHHRGDSRLLFHLGEHAEPAILQRLIALKQKIQSQDLFEQVETIKSILEGYRRRGLGLPPQDLNKWAVSLSRELLKRVKAEQNDLWSESNGQATSPWVVQKRTTQSGDQINVISSLRQGAPGAEQLTGIMRSPTFSTERPVRFWVCGHCGRPELPSNRKNFVRLVDSETNTVIESIEAPRNDVCQLVAWKKPNRKVHFEIVDQDRGDAYAWIGFSAVDPQSLSAKKYLQSTKTRDALAILARVLRHSAPAELREELYQYLPALPPPPARQISAEEQSKLDQLIESRIKSFKSQSALPDSGKNIFRQHCTSCHQISGEGQLVGPQLDGIGQRGIRRLVEDILDPNRNIDAHFLQTVLTLKNGKSTAGFLQSEDANLLHLTDVAGNQSTILKSDIKSREQIRASLMPPTFGVTIPEENFHQLLAWLLKQ